MGNNCTIINLTPEAITRRIRTITIIGLLVNLALVGLKFTGGILDHSQALHADAVHSLSDLITDFAVLFGVRYWSAPPDEDHPYGHGQIEILISAFIGLALGAVAIGLASNALTTLRNGNEQQPGIISFIIALSSIIFKEWVFRATRTVARHVKSSALEANAWHHRSDALSSIPAAIAIAAAHFFPHLKCIDSIGALVVAMFILHAAWQIIAPTLRNLSAKGISQESKSQIIALAVALPQVRSVHALRTHNVGNNIYADLHLEVEPLMTVREGHKLSHQVRKTIIDGGLGIADVMVHLEPAGEADDEHP